MDDFKKIAVVSGVSAVVGFFGERTYIGTNGVAELISVTLLFGGYLIFLVSIAFAYSVVESNECQN